MVTPKRSRIILSVNLHNSQIDCFLFDLDGTLVKTHIDFDRMRETVRMIADRAGAKTDTHANTTILETAQEAAASLGPGNGRRLWMQITAALEEIEADGCADSAEIPGALQLMSYLAANGVMIGVVTRNCRRVSLGLLARHALPCDVLLTRDDVVKTKPDPAHLRDALRILNCDAASAAMVGDHWLDIQAGVAAGCASTIGLLGERRAEWFDRCRPTWIVSDLTEVIDLLRSGESSRSR